MKQVQVDDEVFALVQQHALPLVDDFNAALRKALNIESARSRPGRRPMNVPTESTEGAFPQLDPGMPKALEQILQVVHLTNGTSRSRVDATRLVARHHRVAPQTVLDKYCRQMGLSAGGFDQLLREPGRNQLRARLLKLYPGFRSSVDQVFDR